MIVYLPSAVMSAWATYTAFGDGSLRVVWILALMAAVLMQARWLWRRYTR